MKPLDEELQEIREEFDRNFVHVRNNEPKDDQFAGEKYLPRKVKDFYEQKIRQLVEEREKEETDLYNFKGYYCQTCGSDHFDATYNSGGLKGRGVRCHGCTTYYDNNRLLKRIK